MCVFFFFFFFFFSKLLLICWCFVGVLFLFCVMLRLFLRFILRVFSGFARVESYWLCFSSGDVFFFFFLVLV